MTPLWPFGCNHLTGNRQTQDTNEDMLPLQPCGCDAFHEEPLQAEKKDNHRQRDQNRRGHQHAPLRSVSFLELLQPKRQRIFRLILKVDDGS